METYPMVPTRMMAAEEEGRPYEPALRIGAWSSGLHGAQKGLSIGVMHRTGRSPLSFRRGRARALRWGRVHLGLGVLPGHDPPGRPAPGWWCRSSPE